MNEENLPVVRQLTPEEQAAALGRKMAEVYEENVTDYARLLREKPHEVRRQGDLWRYPYTAEELRSLPPQRVTWEALEAVRQDDPAACYQKWQEIQDDAQQRIRTGLIGAAAVGDRSPSERAEYLELYDELSRDWQPRNGIERNLLDQMVQAYLQFLHWQRTMLYFLSSDEWQRPKKDDPALPRVPAALAVEQAGHMADRFNKIYLRTLRALLNMRRTPVVIQNAAQVNVGQQQVNVAAVGVTPEAPS